MHLVKENCYTKVDSRFWQNCIYPVICDVRSSLWNTPIFWHTDMIYYSPSSKRLNVVTNFIPKLLYFVLRSNFPMCVCEEMIMGRRSLNGQTKTFSPSCFSKYSSILFISSYIFYSFFDAHINCLKLVFKLAFLGLCSWDIMSVSCSCAILIKCYKRSAWQLWMSLK